MLATLIVLLHVTLAVVAGGHALVFKRDSRSAFGWIGMCVVFPVAGPVLYFLFGVNRVHTRAQRMIREAPFRLGVGYERGDYGSRRAVVATDSVGPKWRVLARVSGALTRRPLVNGNSIEPLHNGDAAYPTMLETIDHARERVLLSTYIFETNASGRRFIDALANAERRGVDVRVLLDGFGELYALPWAGQLLRERGVRTERFMRPSLWPPRLDINLRNHRKILVVDGETAFIGGMNIGDRHLLGAGATRNPVADLHFRLLGPVVNQIETVFAEDWRFVTGEVLEPTSMDGSEPSGPAVCRAFTDGPSEDLDTLSLILSNAVSAATERVDIMTPYFIPPPALIAAMQTAALRGVHVRVLLPDRSNLRFVDWATRNMLGELLAFGVDVRYQPSPFVHSKLFVIDGHYAIIGSANIDPRSLRLNFELATEIFCDTTAGTLAEHCDRVGARSRAVMQSEVDERSLPIRVRDSACWLFSPYL
jgi:cardiolipin synthase